MISNIANYLKYNHFWDGYGIDNATLLLWKYLRFLLKTHCWRRRWYHVPHSSYIYKCIFCIGVSFAVFRSWQWHAKSYFLWGLHESYHFKNMIVVCQRQHAYIQGHAFSCDELLTILTNAAWNICKGGSLLPHLIHGNTLQVLSCYHPAYHADCLSVVGTCVINYDGNLKYFWRWFRDAEKITSVRCMKRLKRTSTNNN